MSNEVFGEPFYIEAIEDGVSYSFGLDTKYKINDGDWVVLQRNETSPSINTGSKLYIKSEHSGVLYSFTITNRCRIGGDIKSLSYGDNYSRINKLKYNSQFNRLFYGCSSIIEVDENLLNFTELTERCYASMFEGCINLVNAPILPATTLTSGCYSNMFYGCKNLNHIKMLATDISATNCLNYWVSGVYPIGTFIKHPDAEWDVRGVNGVPDGWTIKFDGIEEEEPSFEFPVYLNTDKCETVFGMTTCTRYADELSISLYQYLYEIINKYGTINGLAVVLDNEVLNNLGIEIYLDNEKLEYLGIFYNTIECSTTEGDSVRIAEDGTITIDKDNNFEP